MSRTCFGGPPSSEAAALQDTYLDLLSMAVETQHLRWVLCTRDSSLAPVVREGLIAQWKRWSGDVAQQLVALDLAPDGRVDTISRSRYHNPVPLGWREPQAVITGLHQELLMRAGWCRDRADWCLRHAGDAESRRLLERIAHSLSSQAAALTDADAHQHDQELRASEGIGIQDARARTAQHHEARG